MVEPGEPAGESSSQAILKIFLAGRAGGGSISAWRISIGPGRHERIMLSRASSTKRRGSRRLPFRGGLFLCPCS